MKKAYMILAAFAVASIAAAQLKTGDVTFYDGVVGKIVYGESGSASGSSTDLQFETAPAALWLNNVTINFDSPAESKLEIASGSVIALGDVKYSIATQGNVELNFKSGSKASLIAKGQGMLSGYKDLETGKIVPSTVSVSVENGYDGTIQLNTLGGVSGTTNLVLDKKNAIISDGKASTSTRLYSSGAKINLSASADQRFIWDDRSAGAFTFDISDGAKILFESIWPVSFTRDQKQTLNSLDGEILFEKSLVTGYDADNLTISVKSGTIAFVNKTGGDVFVGEKTIDGGEYVYISNTQIPEPSTWAAIFGAVALGVAVYRRRK